MWPAIELQDICRLKDAEPITTLTGLATLIGLGLITYGILDRYIINKNLPVRDHPRLVLTAWSLLLSGVLLHTISTSVSAYLIAKSKVMAATSDPPEPLEDQNPPSAPLEHQNPPF